MIKPSLLQNITNIFHSKTHPKDEILNNILTSFNNELTNLNKQLIDTIDIQNAGNNTTLQNRNNLVQDYVKSIIKGKNYLTPEDSNSTTTNNFRGLAEQRHSKHTHLTNAQQKSLYGVFLLIHGHNGLNEDGHINSNMFIEWITSATTNMKHFSLEWINPENALDLTIQNRGISLGQCFSDINLSQNIDRLDTIHTITQNLSKSGTHIMNSNQPEDAVLIHLYNQQGVKKHPKATYLPQELVQKFKNKLSAIDTKLVKYYKQILSILCYCDTASDYTIIHEIFMLTMNDFIINSDDIAKIKPLYDSIFKSTIYTKSTITKTLNELSDNQLGTLAQNSNTDISTIMKQPNTHKS